MNEPFDVYSDQFQVTLSTYGASLVFAASPAAPPAPGQAPQVQTLGAVRMSLEHLKIMTFILRRQLVEYERANGVTVSIPGEVLNRLGIGAEDWQAIWGR